MASVAAVVVTYNRKELLLACLAALRTQTRPVDRIYLIDNASTDGTPDLLKEEGWLADPRVAYRRLECNAGGAGGFHAGMADAYLDQHDWLWLMDDDTLPAPNALERLLQAWERHPATRRPVLLASLVHWTDGSLHLMNRVAVKQRSAHDLLWMAAGLGCLSLRTASFVSLLVAGDMVGRYGLPIRRYFLWGDDMEWTSRVLRHEYGVGVPDSLAVHQTKANYTFMDAGPDRFYLHVRNCIWVLWWSCSHARDEKLVMFANLCVSILRWIWRRRFHPAALWAVAKGGLLSCCSTARPEPAPPRAR